MQSTHNPMGETPFPVWIGPIGGGIIAGLLHTVLGPDHLCTIATLSACQGAKAFWFGVQWAAGHLGGMAVICSVFTLINLSFSGATLEWYEHYADYVVGVLLVSCGVYFVLSVDRYFDKEWALKQKSCACHAHLVPEVGECQPINGHGHSHGTVHGHSHGNGSGYGHGHGHGPTTGLEHADRRSSWDCRDWGATMVGFIQGCACPAGLVGIVFLKHYKIYEMVVFIAVFFLVTTLAMGCLAATYGWITRACIPSAALGRCIYYGSCCLSISLGITWLVLNWTGNLEFFLGHDHDHGAHEHGAHEHGAHDHDHGHEHGHEMSPARFLFLLTAPR